MVMYLLMAAAFVLGAVLLGVGLYLTRQDEFPHWWRSWMLWPLVEVTPRVTHLQGWAGVALGLSILAIGLTPVVPEVLVGARARGYAPSLTSPCSARWDGDSSSGRSVCGSPGCSRCLISTECAASAAAAQRSQQQACSGRPNVPSSRLMRPTSI